MAPGVGVSRDVRAGRWPRSRGDLLGRPDGWGIHSTPLFPAACHDLDSIQDDLAGVVQQVLEPAHPCCQQNV